MVNYKNVLGLFLVTFIVACGGTTSEEDQKFQDDLQRFTEVFFKAEPCKSKKEYFNIRGVLMPSIDSGIDEPRAGIDKQTAVGATFNSMGSERYILTENNKASLTAFLIAS